MLEYLFVYGTLRRGVTNPMAQWLAGKSDFVGQAEIQGRLYLLGSYPGMLPSDNPHDLVRGELYQLSDPAAILATLDDYEGAYEFHRVEGEAKSREGGSVRCWVYCYKLQPPESSRILSGDFLER